MPAESREVLNPGRPGNREVCLVIRSRLDERRRGYIRIDHPKLSSDSVLGPQGTEERNTDANMIVLSGCRQTIGLAGEGFVVERTRLLEEDGLEVAR